MTLRRRPPGPDRGPRPVGESVEQVVGRLGSAGGTRASVLTVVFTRWEEIAGPTLAAHAQPVSLTGGVLTVAVDHGAWATQFRALGATVLDRVAEAAGERPRRLEVRVRRG